MIHQTQNASMDSEELKIKVIFVHRAAAPQNLTGGPPGSRVQAASDLASAKWLRQWLFVWLFVFVFLHLTINCWAVSQNKKNKRQYKEAIWQALQSLVTGSLPKLYGVTCEVLTFEWYGQALYNSFETEQHEHCKVWGCSDSSYKLQLVDLSCSDDMVIFMITYDYY